MYKDRFKAKKSVHSTSEVIHYSTSELSLYSTSQVSL